MVVARDDSAERLTRRGRAAGKVVGATRRANGFVEEPLQPGDAAWGAHQPVAAIDKRDLNSPDAWIPRHPALLRLTGRSALPAPDRYLVDFWLLSPLLCLTWVCEAVGVSGPRSCWQSGLGCS